MSHDDSEIEIEIGDEPVTPAGPVAPPDRVAGDDADIALATLARSASAPPGEDPAAAAEARIAAWVEMGDQVLGWLGAFAKRINDAAGANVMTASRNGPAFLVSLNEEDGGTVSALYLGPCADGLIGLTAHGPVNGHPAHRAFEPSDATEQTIEAACKAWLDLMAGQLPAEDEE